MKSVYTEHLSIPNTKVGPKEVQFMVYKATFNHISVLLVEETGVPAL
jgi:hypothetical protein